MAVVRLKELQAEKEALEQSKQQAMVEEKKEKEKLAARVIKDTDPMGAHIDAMFPGAGATPLQVVPAPKPSQSPRKARRGVKGPILLYVH